MRNLFVTILFFIFISSIISVTYYPACSSSYSSIVDALNSIGVDSSYANRKSIAVLNGISDYSGTAAQNTELLNKLKKGVLIKSNSGSSDTTPSTPTSANAMIKKIENSSNYSAAKKKTLSIIGTLLFNNGYEASFVAGILGNIYHEGNIGMFESSKYISNPSAEPQYLKYMDSLYDYRNKYSGKCVTDVSMSELEKLMAKLKAKNWNEGKFGLGCVQWTGSRTYSLVQLYLKECGNRDKITLEEATAAEGKMIIQEFSGSYKYIYTQWKNDNSNTNSASAAYNAGNIICKKYEVPADYNNKAITRGNTAKELYNLMTS
jgi:hypothetical protein